jgi:Fur family transcriptional regulator, ferric uptake regulator
LTVAPQTPPLSSTTIAEAIAAVRKGGKRLSTARRLVLEALFAAEGPVSATHLAHTLELDESSVYRNLEVLERHGLIRHVHLGHSPGLYVLVRDHEVEYLYCERCTKVTVVAPEQLDPIRQQLKDRFGYQARFTHFALVGLCEPCVARSGSAQPDEPSIEHQHLHSHGDHVHSIANPTPAPRVNRRASGPTETSH